ncbi:MAG: polysaccharide export protein [Sphingomonadales bacterium]|nr:polysaccharide export protein [Sphingomonadales bacterium]MDE2168528.1 polysaccharide export protein [Sphingomonadales bacterium]
MRLPLLWPRLLLGTTCLAISPIALHAAPNVPEVQNSDYRLGPDDKVHITVYGEDRLTGDYMVTSKGLVSFPLIGDIPAAGRSLGEVQEDIRQRLAAGYIRDPRVAIEVGNFRSFYVLGEVNKPGEYPYRTNLTLDQAVATAGGYSYRANKKKIILHHAGRPEQVVQLGKLETIGLQPGDTIRIPERFF